MSTAAVRWIYVLEDDFVHNISHHLPGGWNQNYAFLDKKGTRRLEIHANGDAKVIKGYAWDGCTPKFSVFDILIGTPDGVPNERTKRPKTYYASLVHDVLYQFMDINPDVPKAKADRIFLELMTRDGFAPRHVYFVAVTIFGGLSHRFTRWKRSYEGRRVSLEP
jgi:hypothetical protein